MNPLAHSRRLAPRRTLEAIRRTAAFCAVILAVAANISPAAAQAPSPTTDAAKTAPPQVGIPPPEPRSVTLSSNGRTIAVSRDIRSGVLTIGVIDTRTPLTVCNNPIEIRPGPLSLRYLPLPDVSSPRELGQSEGHIANKAADGTFVIENVAEGQFVIFNLFQEPSQGDKSPITTCWGSVREARGTQERREEEVRTLEEQVKQTQSLMATLRQRIESQRDDATAFGGQAESADRIADILTRVDATRAALTNAEADLSSQQRMLADAQQVLADTPDQNSKNLGMSLSDAEYTITTINAGALLKIGGLLVPPSKGIYYDFGSYSSRTSLQLMPIGDYPIVRYGERQFAVVANVMVTAHPYGFHLAATAQDGAVVNTDPVRPTFAVSEPEAARGAELPARRATSRAYTDVVLPIRGAFAPNQYPEVTISTERLNDDDPAKRTTVTLVDKAKYPQFRALYRYNFNTGVFGSGLRNSEFTKIRTRDDDPATEDVDESLYRIQETETDGPVKPIFAFTYYLKPVDVQAPVSHERWIPNPTVGFAFENPADNIYFGFSHEILRNAQLFWGWHWGQVKELVARNEVSEDRDGSAPPTRDGRKAAFGVAVTFNVAVITKIFK